MDIVRRREVRAVVLGWRDDSYMTGSSGDLQLPPVLVRPLRGIGITYEYMLVVVEKDSDVDSSKSKTPGRGVDVPRR